MRKTLIALSVFALLVIWATAFGQAPVAPLIPTAGAEPPLGNPAADGYLLASTALGVRSWYNVAGALALKAPLASPALTGTPTSATTPAASDSSTTLANTAYVKSQRPTWAFSATDTLCGNSGDASCTLATSITPFATTASIPSGYLTANRGVRITICYNVTTPASPATETFMLYVGATNIMADNGGVPFANSSNYTFCNVAHMQGTAAAGASAAVYTGFLGSGPAGFTALYWVNTVAQPINLATNGAITVTPYLVFTGTKNTGNFVTLNQLIVELL